MGRASRGLALAAVIVAVLLCAGSCLAYTNGDPEFRAFWVDCLTDHPGLQNQAEVDKLLGVPGDPDSIGDIRRANCNAVMVEVRRGALTCYQSHMGEDFLTLNDFDSLAAVIAAAHDTTGGKKRIEVHAWLVTFTAGGDVWTNHTGTPTGSLTNLDNYWPTQTYAGGTDGTFDPGHPKCEKYIADVFLDVATNYDVDGIHYDYIRFNGGDCGYNPTSVARFNAKHGTSGKPAIDDPDFRQWRRDQVTALVRQVYARVQAEKPNVLVSGSFVTWNPSPAASTRAAFMTSRPYGDRTQNDGVFSDWDSWMQEGILDFGVPMNYYDDSALPADYVRWMNFLKDRKFNRQMVNGPGLYKNYLNNNDVINQILATRDASPAGNNCAGFCGFSYFAPYVVTKPTTYGSWDAFATQLLSQVTPTWADIPERPWKTQPTTGHISGRVTVADSGAWADGATISISPDPRPSPYNVPMTCDGTGFYAFIDLPPGTYTVTASVPGFPDISKQVTVAIGAVTGNMYVTDFAMDVCVPTISGAAVSNVTSNSATITWNTNILSDTSVNYGLTSSYGSQQSDAASVISHSITLTGLNSATTYHYQCASTGPCGTTTTADLTFTTDGCAPLLTGITATAITNTTATITWTTSDPADSAVNYGTTGTYGSQQTNPALVTSHSVTLTGLSPKTTYHYMCSSTNACGLRSSVDYTFVTNGPPVISNLRISGIRASNAMISWTTDTAADATVNYGTTTAYGDQQAAAGQTTSHVMLLQNLTPNTTYHYQCVSANPYGSTASVDYTFTSLASTAEVIVDNTDGGWTNTGNGSWTAGSVAGVPKIGTNYLTYKGDGSTTQSSATHKCQWIASLNTTGLYDVFAYYQKGSNRNTAAPYTVNYFHNTVTSIQNQYQVDPNGGGWFLLGGDLPFLAGGVSLVELTTLSTDTKLVSADAVKWVLKSVQDVTKPSLVNVKVSATKNSATVTWNTDFSSDSTVNYGATAGYGSQQASPAYTTKHSLVISGLTPGTTYHYQCASANIMGTTSGNDYTFSTLSQPGMVSVTDEKYTTSTTSLEATWAATDARSTIARYDYSVGTTPGGTEVKGWTDAGPATSCTITGLSLGYDSTYYISARATNADGVTSDPMHSSGLKVARSVDNTQGAKDRQDGDAIALPELVVSAGFSNKFYVEEANRISGIRVESGETVTPGQTVTVLGVMGLADGCERAILDPKVIKGTVGTRVTPVSIIGSAVGGINWNSQTPGISDGNGLYNIGLLVRLAGAAGGVSSDGFYLYDGSTAASLVGPSGIKVWTGSSTSPGNFVIVTGVVSSYKSGDRTYPLILATQITPM